MIPDYYVQFHLTVESLTGSFEEQKAGGHSEGAQCAPRQALPSSPPHPTARHEMPKAVEVGKLSL